MPRSNQKYVQEVICATLAQARQNGIVEGVSFSEKQWTIRLKRCPWCIYTYEAPTNFILDVDTSDENTYVFLNDKDGHRARLYRHVKAVHHHRIAYLDDESYSVEPDTAEAEADERGNTDSNGSEAGEESDLAEDESESESLRSEDEDEEVLDHILQEEVEPNLDKKMGRSIPPGVDWDTKDGDRQTLRGVLVALFALQDKGAFSLSTLQYILNLMRCFMTEDELEIMPESVHLMNKVLKVENLAGKKQHVCSCCSEVKGVELLTEEEKGKALCGNCKANLFVSVDGNFTPSEYFFNFGVGNQITALFQRSDFRALRTTGRDDPTGIYASNLPRGLMDVEPNILEANRSIWSVAIDGVQPYENTKHSSVKIALRCEDIPFRERGKAKFLRTLALIPGPSEPSSSDTFLCQIGREFEKLRQEGLRIRYIDEETGIWKETVHYPVWRFIMADAKGREKVLHEKGANSYYPCVWCCQRADRVEKEGKRCRVCIRGIRSSATYTSLDTGEDQVCSPRMNGGDVPRPTMEQIRSLLNRIEEEQKKKWDKNPESQLEKYTSRGRHAWKGSPQLFKIVPTLHILDSFPLPIYHLLLLNIVRRFLSYLYDGLKRTGMEAARDYKDRGMKIQISNSELERLEASVISTCDMKKRYSPLKHCYTWISEELGAFVRVFSPYIFDSKVSGISVLTPKAEEAWKHLRTFTMYYLGYPSDRDEAIKSLMTFGGMCEEESELLMTSQLHTAICRLPQQEERLGRAFHLGELWMEREIRSSKNSKASKNVDESHAIRILKKEAMERHLLLLKTDTLLGEYRPRLMQRNVHLCDAGCTSSEGFSYQLKGPGKEAVYKYLSNLANGKGAGDNIKTAMATRLKNALDQYRQRRGNSKLPNAGMAMLEYKSMLISRQGFTEEVKSSRSRETKRRSNYVEIEFNRERKIAEVLIFFKISRVERNKDKVERVIDWTDEDPLVVCRFAVVHIFKARLQDGVFRVESGDPETAYQEQFCVIPITDIIGKVFGALYHPELLNPHGRKRPRIDPLTSPRAVFKPHEVHYDIFT